MAYNMENWIILSGSVLLGGLCVFLIVFVLDKRYPYKGKKENLNRNESLISNLLGRLKKSKERNNRRKEYSYLEDHFKWVRDRLEGDRNSIPGSSASEPPSLASLWADKDSKLRSELNTLFRDKLHLFQKLNYHRVVEEMNKQIWFVTVLLVVVALACFVLPFIYYKANTLEPEANTEYAAFIRKIDSLHNEAGFLKNPNDSDTVSRIVRADSISSHSSFSSDNEKELSMFRQKAMDAKFLAMAEFSAGYTSFLFLKQALIRVVTMAFLFTILGYLLKMYRRLLDKRTRFRQLEEATTITLFYLFKKGVRATSKEEIREAKLIKENLPKMIDKLYDFSVIEPAKGGKEEAQLASTISEMNKAITDVYKMMVDLRDNSRASRK